MEFFAIIRKIYNEFISAADMILRNPHHIGYNAGAKFMQSIGCESEKIDLVYIVSNVQEGLNRMNITLNGIIYMIDGPKHGIITDENYGYKLIAAWVQSKYFRKDQKTLEAIDAFIKEHGLTRGGFDTELKTYTLKANTRVNGLLDDIDKLKYHPEP